MDPATPPASPNEAASQAIKKASKGTYQWFLMQSLDKQITSICKSVESLQVSKTDYPRAIPFNIASSSDMKTDFKGVIRGVINFTPFLGPYGNWQDANTDSVSNCLATTPIAISQMISIGTR
jgi:hypothetical protein